MNNRVTFRKSERISLKREIDCLFQHGESFVSYPLRVVYLEQKPSSETKVSVLISVPKRKIKHAVKRNRMKRLIREAYRLNKATLIEHYKGKESGLLIAFLFIGNEICNWDIIEESVQKAIRTLVEKTE